MGVNDLIETSSVIVNNEVIPKTAQKELTDLLGPKNACFTRELLACYRCGPGAPFRKETVNPDGMVQPETVEDVQGIIKIANKYKIPLIVQSTGLGEICFNGGLIVDLYSRMRKIHQIDPESGYALIEPGMLAWKALVEMENASQPDGAEVVWSWFAADPLPDHPCMRSEENNRQLQIGDCELDGVILIYEGYYGHTLRMLTIDEPSVEH